MCINTHTARGGFSRRILSRPSSLSAWGPKCWKVNKLWIKMPPKPQKAAYGGGSEIQILRLVQTLFINATPSVFYFCVTWTNIKNGAFVKWRKYQPCPNLGTADNFFTVENSENSISKSIVKRHECKFLLSFGIKKFWKTGKKGGKTRVLTIVHI